MNFFSSAWARVVRHKFFAVLGIVIVLGGGYYWYKSSATATSSVSYVTAAVTKGTVVSTVSGTGQVAASSQLDIKPQSGGTITSVAVNAGDTVKEGQTLVTLDQQSASVQVAQARASYAQAQASYDKLMEGSASTDISAAQQSLEAAQQSLQNAQASASTSIASAQLSLANAQKNYTLVQQQQAVVVASAKSNYLNAGLTAVPSETVFSTAAVTVTGSYSGSQEGQYIVSVYNTGLGQYYTVSGLGSQNAQLVRGLPLALGNGLYITFASTGIISPNTTWTIAVPNTQASGYLSAYNSYQTALQNQTSALQNAQNSVDTAQAALVSAQNQAQSQTDSAQNNVQQAQISLQSKLSPPEHADIESAKAQLASAAASLANAENNYSNTIIKAPFDGVVAVVNAKKGDQASSAAALVTMVTQQQVATVSLNEVDAAKVKVGQKVTLTFPAIDGLSISGKVGEIDQIGTVTQNVVNFNVKILLDTQDDRVKPGMSVSATIITNVKQDVLTVPSAAVKSSSSGSYVQELKNGKPVQHSVTVGISSDTETEISGDVKEGDEVVTQTVTNTAAKTSTQSSSNSLIPGLGGGGNVRINAGGAGFRGQ